jgi:Leucine-rich repeat (LRR) protein
MLPQTSHISSSSGVHWGGKCNDDVLGIDGKDKIIQYFPKGLNLIFRNLKAIDIENGRIKELNQNDLMPYTNLEYLDLGNNDIEVLMDGVFDYNPKLKVISLSRNKLYKIGTNVFTGLYNLDYLVLEGNRCIDENAKFDFNGVQNIIKNAKLSCQIIGFYDGHQPYY